MERYDIRGNKLTGSIFESKCGECGMPTLSEAEFHPYEACKIYKRTHDSRDVWLAIVPLMRARLGIAG